MNKKIATFLLICLCVTLTGCSLTEAKKIARFSPKVARAATISTPSEQSIEVFDLSKDSPQISFTKSAIAHSKDIAYVVPQTTGKVTNVRVKLGDKVRQGTTLITLGDSLPTDISEIQYQTALKALDLAQVSELFTDDSAKKTIQTSAIGVKLAYESYENAQRTLDNAEKIYDEQRDSAEIGKSTATDGLNFSSKSLAKLDNAITQLRQKKDVLESELASMDSSNSNYTTISESLAKVEEAIATAEAQKDTVDFSKKTASRGIEQADNGLDLLERSFKAQKDQMEFAIEAAKKQYDMAVKQFGLAANGANLQKLGVQTQVLQLDSASQIAALSNEQKNIKSPITGYVTEIQAQANNFVATGQPVAKVENPAKLTIKTSVNSDEATLLAIGQTVKIQFNSKEIEGTITAISPSLSDTARKINVEIAADNKNESIIAGSLVKVIFSSTQDSRIFIPLNSLRNSDNDQFVTVIQNNKAHLQNVEIGEIVGDYVEIISGLNGNEIILKTADSFLNEGDSVNIQK